MSLSACRSAQNASTQIAPGLLHVSYASPLISLDSYSRFEGGRVDQAERPAHAVFWRQLHRNQSRPGHIGHSVGDRLRSYLVSEESEWSRWLFVSTLAREVRDISRKSVEHPLLTAMITSDQMCCLREHNGSHSPDRSASRMVWWSFLQTSKAWLVDETTV
jgi:hypothetical protein